MRSTAIGRQALELGDRLIAIRRAIHAHPELGFEEHETARVIAESMHALGASVRTGIARTGVVAELGTRGPVVAIRADMDALPIVEATGLPFASTIHGADRVVTLPFDTWTEDFGYMTAVVPGAMFWLGVTGARVPDPVWHSPTFDLEEDAIPVGAAVLAATALRLLAAAPR